MVMANNEGTQSYISFKELIVFEVEIYKLGKVRQRRLQSF